MIREILKKDLAGIFQISRIDFSNSLIDGEQELDNLFVIIDQDGIKNNFRQGENYFALTGTLEIINDQTVTDFGYFSQRKALTKFEARGKLQLIGRESNEPLETGTERLLIKKSQKFIYRVSIPYNKPIGEIEEFEIGNFSTT
jgi:hypothetical protein